MSNETQELNIDQLQDENGAVEATATKKEKKVLTAEDVAAITAATEKIREFGVSDNFSKVLPLVSVWHDAELSAPVKAEVIEAFGGSDKFKDYIGAEFEAELAVVSGIVKAVSVLNNVKSFYKRRGDGTARVSKKKEATIQINIGGEPYTISQAYYETIVSLPNEEKKQLLLEHPATKKAEAIEVL